MVEVAIRIWTLSSNQVVPVNRAWRALDRIPAHLKSRIVLREILGEIQSRDQIHLALNGVLNNGLAEQSPL